MRSAERHPDKAHVSSVTAPVATAIRTPHGFLKKLFGRKPAEAIVMANRTNEVPAPPADAHCTHDTIELRDGTAEFESFIAHAELEGPGDLGARRAPWELPLYQEWLTLPHLFPNEKKQLETRVDALANQE